jgi:hypothetical protein
MIQTFPKNEAVFQEDNAPTHTAGTVQSCFEEHEGEHHIPWPAQLPDLNSNEPLLSVLETRVRNRFPAPTSLKKTEDVLYEEWYHLRYRLFKSYTSPFQEGLRLY